MLGQLIDSGLAVGFCYALLALAMVIIYKTSEVLNFAQGEMAMISAFVAFLFLDSYQFSLPVGLLLTLLFAAALGAALEFVFVNPCIVLVMHLMFIEKSSLCIIGVPDIPHPGVAAFQLDEFKYVHDNDFR